MYKRQAVVQYARPEIIVIVVGAFVISAATKEYRSTAGSSPMTRFVLGIATGSYTHLGVLIMMLSISPLMTLVALLILPIPLKELTMLQIIVVEQLIHHTTIAILMEIRMKKTTPIVMAMVMATVPLLQFHPPHKK